MNVPIEKITKKYGLSAARILKLVDSHLVSGLKNDERWFINESSLKNYLHYEKEVRRNKMYLQRLLAEKKEEIEYILARHDDFLFVLRSLDKYSPVFEMVIKEMSLLIQNEKDRDIFLDIALNRRSIYEIAKRGKVTYDRVCSIYQRTLRQVCRKAGFMRDSREQIAQLKAAIHTLKAIHERQERRIETLCITLKENGIEIRGNTIENVLYLNPLKQLSEQVWDMGFSGRLVSVLRLNDVTTVYDLLRIIKNQGYNGLLDLKDFGPCSLQEVKNRLIKKGLLDDRGKSLLFSYIE